MTHDLLSLARATGTVKQFDFRSALESKSPEFVAGFCVWCEARGATFAAKLGVAFVIRNRVHAGSEFGNDTVLGVVAKPEAFSSLDAGDPNHAVAVAFLTHPERYESTNAWQDSIYAARGALSPVQAMLDPTHGALFYHDSRLTEAAAAWGDVKRTAVLDDLTFYAKA